MTADPNVEVVVVIAALHGVEDHLEPPNVKESTTLLPCPTRISASCDESSLTQSRESCALRSDVSRLTCPMSRLTTGAEDELIMLRAGCDSKLLPEHASDVMCEAEDVAM